MRKQTENQGRALETGGGFQQALHISRLPAVGNEKVRTFRGTEFKRRACFAQTFPGGALHHLEQSGRGNFRDPALKCRERGKVPGQGCYFLRTEIDEQALGEHEGFFCPTVELSKKGATGVDV